MNQSEAEAVAKGLTEAQQNLLFFWPKGLFDETTRRALVRKLLIDGRAVTPLGREVISILTRDEP